MLSIQANQKMIEAINSHLTEHSAYLDSTVQAVSDTVAALRRILMSSLNLFKKNYNLIFDCSHFSS
jgi:predicted transcriptional regulator